VDNPPEHWPPTPDPADDAFDAALEAAIARLPDQYRAQLATVAIVVADEATPEELATVGAAGLYGLYRGVPRTAFGADHVPIPSVITLYRGPLERRWRGPEALVHGVEETLRHELAHHLGISDARLDELHNGG
jgi:predicted Zn-dependent protease with MMP-like domain